MDDRILAELKRQLEAGTLRCTWVQNVDPDTETWQIGFGSKDNAKVQFEITAVVPADEPEPRGNRDMCEARHLGVE